MRVLVQKQPLRFSVLDLYLALAVATTGWHGVLQACVLHYSTGKRKKIFSFPQQLEWGGPSWLFSFLYGVLAILALNNLCSHQHVPPCLRQALGLKHSLKASDTLGFSGPLLDQLMVPLLLQVGTKAVATDTKVTLAAPIGHAVDK